MKKQLIVIIFIAILVVSLIACNNKTKNDNGFEKANNAEYIRLTFISPMIGNPYWDMVEDGIMDAAEENGVNIKTIGPKIADANDQIEAIESAIAAKVDGIITMALDSEAFVPVIDKAVENGIPIILVDTDAPNSKRTLYIGTSNIDAGYKAGQIMIEATGGIAKIGIITGQPEQENINERVAGFKHAIKTQPDIQILSIESGFSDLMQISEKTRIMLKEHPEITAFFCAEGYGAVGVVRILKEKDLVGKVKIIGFDDISETVDYVNKGIVTATIVQQPYQMGHLSVDYLTDIIKGKSIDNDTLYMDLVVLTKNNIETYSNEF